MNQNKRIIYLAAAGFFLIFFAAFFSGNKTKINPLINSLGGGFGQTLTNLSTSTQIEITTSSVQILAAFPQGSVRKICNNGNNNVYLGYGQAAVANEGAVLTSGGGCENLIKGGGDYWGLAINGITSTGTSSVTVVEY